jgi:hypothetical protein
LNTSRFHSSVGMMPARLAGQVDAGPLAEAELVPQ